MALLLNCQNIAKSFGLQHLFEGVVLSINERDRIGLIGPNGAGKSTLLKMIAGLEEPDEGQIVPKKGLRVAYVAQKDDLNLAHTIMQAFEAGTNDVARMHTVLGMCDFDDTSLKIESLSGGWRKRIAIGLALLKEPDLLLLDEPTNHLDIESIYWLEKIMNAATYAFVLISHDRYFLESTCRQIIEVHPQYEGGFLKVDGPYSLFLERRGDLLVSQKRQQERLASKVRREVAWLKRGAKARTTKAQSRIDSALDLQDDLGELKTRNRERDKLGLEFSSTGRETRKLVKTHQLCFAYGENKLVHKLNLLLTPGKRIGLMGRNGTGKSTIMQLIAGRIQPDAGQIKTAEGVKILYFNQNRDELNMQETLKESLSFTGGDFVVFQGRELHIVSWAKKFLFRNDQLNSAVGSLSGGEQARILLARLMLQPADVLLLDEPTNDLDIPSLEILEESLLSFPGAVILVSHDRYLIDSISTEILGLDGQGGLVTYADSKQWYRDMASLKEKGSLVSPKTNQVKAASQPVKKAKKLTYKDQREYDLIEKAVQKAEAELEVFKLAVADPKIATDTVRLTEVCDQLQKAQEVVDKLYARWDELETLKASFE